MTIDNSFFSDPATPPPAPANATLAEISSLAAQQIDLMERIDAAEQHVKDLKEQLRRIAEGGLPDAMVSVGMTTFQLDNGFSVNINDGVAASIRAGKEVDACNWLDEQELGDVVKDEIKIKFGRGDDPSPLLMFCQENNIPAEEKLTVHPSTLVALVKEQMAQGREFPEEFFSVYPWKKAEIKAPKVKK